MGRNRKMKLMMKIHAVCAIIVIKVDREVEIFIKQIFLTVVKVLTVKNNLNKWFYLSF
jgi:hypothetical protein